MVVASEVVVVVVVVVVTEPETVDSGIKLRFEGRRTLELCPLPVTSVVVVVLGVEGAETL